MRGHDFFRFAALAACLVCYVTILLGGNVMASDSGLACPDWPTCHGSFLPALTGGTGIEWSHRLSAVVLGLAVFAVTALALAYERSRPVLLELALASALTVFAQAIVGAVVVRSDLTVWVVLLHLALATALFALLLLLGLLANLKEIPRRWVDWARRASDPAPASSLAATPRPRRGDWPVPPTTPRVAPALPGEARAAPPSSD
jgi:heme A synthase